MLGDLIDGMYHRKKWLENRLKYLQEVIDSDGEL